MIDNSTDVCEQAEDYEFWLFLPPPTLAESNQSPVTNPQLRESVRASRTELFLSLRLRSFYSLHALLTPENYKQNQILTE